VKFNINSEEVKSLLAAIDDLLDIKLLIRKIVPDYDLNEELNEKFISLLFSLQKKLQPLFSKYLKQDDKISSKKKSIFKLKENIQEIMERDDNILISANSSKKKIKNLGFNPQNLIVSGGPLFIEDYKIINPNITNKALEGIKKKCERFTNQLKDKNWKKKDLIFIYEKENPTDKLILKKLDEISNIIRKKVKTIEIKSWKALDD